MILYKKIKASLPHLALYIQRHKNTQEIKGIIGITLLNKGCERLGFESYAISSRSYKWFKQLAFYPIYLLSTPKLNSKGRKKNFSHVFIYVKRMLVKKILNYLNTFLEASP